MTNPPKGYIFRSAPKSVQEAVSRASHDRIKSVTRQAVQAYIEGFMNSTGVRRSITEAVGSLTKMFITDKDTLVTDPTLRPTQIARYTNEIKERMPAIIIVDSGMEWVDPGLNVLDHATHFGPRGSFGEPTMWQGQFPLTYNIPVSIIAAANDQESADSLGSFLSLIFGPLRNLSGGSRITGRLDKGDTWEVRLPLSFATSATTNSSTNEDPKDAVWSMTVDMIVQFEDRIILQQTMPTIEFPAVGKAQVSNLAENLPPVIYFPDTIKLNETNLIRVDMFKDSHKICLSDGRIATFDPETLFITARRLGTFEVQVVNLQRVQASGAALAPEVVARKQVEVVL